MFNKKKETITLNSVHHSGSRFKIYIPHIYQTETYYNLLMGYPNSEMNKKIIDDLKCKAKNIYKCFGEPYLIPPQMKKISYDSASESLIGEWQSRENIKYEKMPDIACIALLECPVFAIQGDIDYSALILIWFQERYAYPIDSDVVDYIQDIDWNHLANDYPI